MACYDFVLGKIHSDFPDIVRIFEKSDNATCFKNADFIRGRPAIAARHGITVTFPNRQKETSVRFQKIFVLFKEKKTL